MWFMVCHIYVVKYENMNEKEINFFLGATSEERRREIGKEYRALIILVTLYFFTKIKILSELF